jgi:DNA-directed RNA polymerase subunit RPC12/RpoP
MASTFVIACPDCSKQIKVTEEVIGKKIRCKECGGIFPVKKPKETVPAKNAPTKKDGNARPPDAEQTKKKTAAELNQDDDDGKNPYALAKEEEGVARCPNCVKELESPDAKICLHCGFNMETRKRHEVVAVYEPTGAETFQWLLPGIAAAIGVIAMVTISIILWVNTRDWMRGGWFHDEENGKDIWLIKPGCFQFFNIVVSGFVSYHLGRIAYRRLVVDNKPPERTIQKEDEDDIGEGEDD